MDTKQRTSGPLVIAMLFLLLLVGIYAAGYFCLSEVGEFIASGGQQDVILRHFKSPLACWAYKPASRVEGKVRGIPVKVWHTDPFE